MSSGIVLPTFAELHALSKSLDGLDAIAGQTMADVRRIQKWSYKKLFSRFCDINEERLTRYMQGSYLDMRPIHVLAAFSWVTMIPMTSFFKGVKVMETDRGMDNSSIEAIIRCGQLSVKRFQWVLEVMCDFHSEDAKSKYKLTENRIYSEFGRLTDYNDSEFMPPAKLSIIEFGNDYYYSIARALKDFRRIHKLSAKDMALALGLSIYRYELLENEKESKVGKPFSLHIGLRARLAFRSHSHVEFTKYMEVYPEFHELRIVQHIREALIVEAFRYVPKKYKRSVIKIMNEMASIQTK